MIVGLNSKLIKENVGGLRTADDNEDYPPIQTDSNLYSQLTP